jgi:hypothetical protein
VPLRRRYGFTVLGGWELEDTSQFLWLVGYDGPDDFAAADEAYYAAPERKALHPDPARHVATAQTWIVEVPDGQTRLDH